MEFGLSCNKIDEVGVVVHAENLGYDFCGMTDSPMIRSNVWAVMALVAQQTRRLRSGIGVAVPGLRLAPVAVMGSRRSIVSHLVDASSVWGPVTQRCGCSGIPLRRLQNFKSISVWSACCYAVRKLTLPWMG